MTKEQIAHRIRDEHRKYGKVEGMDWALIAASKIWSSIYSNRLDIGALEKAFDETVKLLTKEDVERWLEMDRKRSTPNQKG
jgi:hypothetical protein